MQVPVIILRTQAHIYSRYSRYSKELPRVPRVPRVVWKTVARQIALILKPYYQTDQEPRVVLAACCGACHYL